MLLTRPAFALLGLLLLTAPAFATQAGSPAGTAPSPSPPPSEAEPPRREETVDVEAELPALPPSSTAAMRLPVPVKDLPVTVSVIPARLLLDQAAFVLGDALRNASGVNVGTGFGVFDFFTIRGFDSLTSGLVLTDGVAEPESTFYPVYNVRQVEVLKGPAAFLYGANPLAGAVQIVRKRPSAARFAQGSLTYGRFGTFEGALDGNAATSDGRLSFRFNGVWQGTDHRRDLDGGSIAGLNPTLAWAPDPDTRVGLSFEYVRSHWPPDTGLPFVGESGSALAPVPRTRSYQSPFDASEQDVYRLRLDAERRLGEHFTLRNRFYFTQLEWDSDGTLIGGAFPFPDGRTYVVRSLVLLEDRQRLLGDQLELASGFRTGAVAHDLLVGVEVSRLQDRFVQDVALLPALDLLEPVEPPGRPTPVTIAAFGLAGDSRALVLAPYLVDRLTLSRRWQAFLGARFDTFDYEDRPSRTVRDESRLSPLLGLVFSPSDVVSLHASAGTAFAPPSTQVVGPRDPETSRSAELGAKLQFLRGKAFVGATAYVLEREAIAIPDASGIFKQDGDQRSRGLELDVSAEPARGLVTYVAYAFTDAELTRFAEAVQTPVGPMVFDRSGNVPSFVPRHLLNVWISKEWRGGLGLAAGLRALSEQFAGEDNRYRVPGYATLDAAAWYDTGRARFGVNLKNLTGTEYVTRGFGGVSAIPARPFEVLGRIDVRLGAR
ncbi:MAG TPA: TonB-dependent siderophore receptor [Vicinamibacteria bacterium]|nr:TonB-dependent siderophore receptor [Vicinamibacteria bacterium]